MFAMPPHCQDESVHRVSPSAFPRYSSLRGTTMIGESKQSICDVQRPLGGGVS
jgi:hypothetical protein